MPKFAFNDIMFPVKLAVFPLSAKLTVKLFVILLPVLKLPVTSKLVSVPTLVMFGCEDTVTFPA